MESNDMAKKIAYMIMAHRDPTHLRELVSALDYGADFYVYIDKKSEIANFMKELSGRKNVIFIRKREGICWGG